MKDKTLKPKKSTPVRLSVKISGPGVIYTSSADVVSSPEGQKQIKYLRKFKELIKSGEGHQQLKPV